MSKTQKKPKKPSGAENLIQRGLVCMQVPMTEDVRHRLKVAAAIADMPTNQFILEAAIKAADKTIQKVQ